jgi:hypothetical protein
MYTSESIQENYYDKTNASSIQDTLSMINVIRHLPSASSVKTQERKSRVLCIKNDKNTEMHFTSLVFSVLA